MTTTRIDYAVQGNRFSRIGPARRHGTAHYAQNVSVRYNETFHDRFIIVDQKEIFWTGASLKDAGRLTFAVAKMGAEIIPGLLESIRKATSERREYGKGKKVVCAKGANLSPKSRK